MRQTVYYWPDDTWCYKDELRFMTHMSDDYAEGVFPEDYSPDQIEKEIVFANKWVNRDRRWVKK